FQLCVGLFPEKFFPELIGMTLYLEWEATPTLTPTVRMLRGRGINPFFFQLHVAIDNISECHGALAKEVIKSFLQKAEEEGGNAEVQVLWQRIWNGYVTWATVGSIGYNSVARRLVLDRKRINIGTVEDPNCWPDLVGFAKNEMLRLVGRKAVE